MLVSDETEYLEDWDWEMNASIGLTPDQTTTGSRTRVYWKYDASAVQLWNYFRSVLDWVQAIFPRKRKEMKGLPWGLLYNKHGQRTDLNPVQLEQRIQQMIGDEDVTRKSGIYEYLLTGEEKKLSIRSFDRRDALSAYEKQHHKCALCGESFEFEQMYADHILPWSRGGKTTPENCQMLCVKCNLAKGGAQIYSMQPTAPEPKAAESTTEYES